MAKPNESTNDVNSKQADAIEQHEPTASNAQECDEEEFVLHLKFDHGSYPLRHNVNEIEFLGITNGNLFVRIGDSYFQGEYDQRNNSSILFSYDNNQLVYETNKCHSKIFMKRVLLKSKNGQPQSQSDN